jgi:hypothetical protein
MDAMPLESFPSRIAASLFSARTPGYLISAACGTLVMCWIQQALAGFGTSLTSQTALVIVGLLAVGIASAIASGLTALQAWKSPVCRLSLLVILQAILAVTVLFPGLFRDAGWLAIDSLLGESLPAGAGQLGILSAGLMASWLVPFTAVVLLLARPTAMFPATSEDRRDGRLIVAAVTAATAMTILSGTLGLNGVAWFALTIGLFGAAIEIALLWRSQPAQEPVDVSTNAETLSARPSTDFPTGSGIRSWKFLAVIPVVILAGVLFASLSRVSGQLFFAASWQSVVQWSSVILIAIFSRRLAKRPAASASYILVIAAAWSVATLAAWPLLVRLCLEINSSISTVAIAGTARAIITIACVAPVGILLGAVAKWRDDKQDDSSSAQISGFQPALLLSAFLCGWLACRWWMTTSIAASSIVVVLAIAIFVIAIEEHVRRTSWRSALRPVMVVCGVVVLAGPFLAERYDPTTSAKLLFDTAVFVAHQHEARTDTLPYLDEGRCIATVEADHGTLTFWRYRGQQLQVRESGLPLSSVSCNTNICTQPSAESLQAILPMVLHEGPTRLLLLGIRSGAVLQTSIAFPLESIVCVDADQNVIDAVSDQVFARVTHNPLDDARVTLQTAEPLLKLRSAPRQADIIIASADQQGVPQAAAMITAEFLTTASHALREGGLYCQPLDYADFGPDALQIIVETWQSVFSEIAAIEIAPGKLLLIGTNSETGVIRPGIIDRLQRPNVRFALAQTGWDWSTPLRLAVYTDQGLTTAFGESRHGVSDVAGSRLTCLLPWEVMRWGDKYSAIMKKLGPVGQSLQFTVGKDAYSAEVKNRLAELTEQQELIHEHPDEYWFYRRKVKDRLTKTPQSELVQVKGEEPLHELQENEKRRVDYFKALQTVEEFSTPHDPLISLFLHQELAELANRNRETNFKVELRHRLHRIYFTTSTDQAVRNVIASIEILCDHPEAIPDDAGRADQLDALLQTLHNRWHNRGETPPGSSKIVLNDIEQSVAAIDKAFGELASLNSARGYSPEQWQSRRLALEKSLLRPLQAYRTTLMPHHAKSARNR